MASMPKWCFPKKLITLGLLMKHNERLRYGNKYALQDIENCTKFYHGMSLTVTTKGIYNTKYYQIQYSNLSHHTKYGHVPLVKQNDLRF